MQLQRVCRETPPWLISFSLGFMNPLTYRQMEPSETPAVSALACQVFDQFVAPDYQPDGVLEFHRYADPEAFSLLQKSGHITLVAEQSGEFARRLLSLHGTESRWL